MNNEKISGTVLKLTSAILIGGVLGFAPGCSAEPDNDNGPITPGTTGTPSAGPSASTAGPIGTGPIIVGPDVTPTPAPVVAVPCPEGVNAGYYCHPITGELWIGDDGNPVPVGEGPAPVSTPTPTPTPSPGGSPAPTASPGVPWDDDDEQLPIDNVDPPPECGDGWLDPDENCDDGLVNTDGVKIGGEGCSALCQVEPGWVCPTAGAPCIFTNYCGDGRVTPPESCDDGNDEGGDGCSADCFREAGWACPNPGEPCVYTVVCGDGNLGGTEQCDDGNANSGDGCNADCELEPGWECPTAGLRCTPVCGDGTVTGREVCDDGNTVGGDGCNAACQVEDGWVCDGSGCRRTVCGDGEKEGSEGCDDGENNHMGDGCSPGCTLEPDCSAMDGSCRSRCGDGMIIPGDDEECDDGNNLDGDGCSADCQEEAGFACTTVTIPPSELPIIYRDFYGVGYQAGDPGTYNATGHPDFEIADFSRNTPRYTARAPDPNNPDQTREWGDIAGPSQGLVNVGLGQGQTDPVLRLKPTFLTAGNPVQLTNGTNFLQWYTDVTGVNVTIKDTLTLTQQGNLFFFDSETFFPLDNLGLTAAGAPAPGPEPMRTLRWLDQADCGERLANGEWQTLTGGPHNFSFTSEVRFWFEFQGGEQLTFRGDDDVWVFIKRRLVVDLGGVHEPFGGDVCGNTWSHPIETQPTTCTGLATTTMDRANQPLGLQPNTVYEAVVWQAERHRCASNYRLTLTNFARARSECQSVCGDGIVAGDEQCDDGEQNGAGYGFCTTNCTPGPRCGDGMVNGDEQCDNGVNLDTYYADGACAPGCVYPPFCGDGEVQPSFGEQCDLGAESNTGEYGGCSPDCTLGPRCGDGILQAENGETCDDGNRIAGDDCSPICTIEPKGVPK